LQGKYIFPTPAQLEAVHDRCGITGGALMVLCNAEEYVPQSVGEVIDIANASGGRYVPFCNLDPRAMNNTPTSHLEYLLDHFKSLGCKGVGEVLPRMAFDDPKMMNLYRAAESVGLPLLFDMNSSPKCSYGLFDEPGLVRLRRALEAYPDLVFIGHGPGFWAEFGTLRHPDDRFTYIQYPIDGEGMIPKLMREYPNLYVDLSADSGLYAISRNLDYTANFFEEFSDRVLFGTDICFADQYAGQSDFMNRMLDSGKISERVYDKIARENALKLLGLDA
jgi:predicted TIM-barrel fold metal-dependent hydrolase